MADVQVLYAESVAATTATSTTWVDVASISSGSFTANKKYLIIANQVSKIDSASAELRVRLVRGTTPTVFDDASLAYEGVNAAMEHELSYMFMYTQPGTPETIKLQISNSATSTVTNILSQIIAINMDDLGTDGVDYFWNEFLTDYTMTSTPTAKAITSSFTPNGTDRWLFIGHMIYDVVTIVDEIGFELYDSVAGVLNKGWVEGEDATNDFKGFNLFWVGVPTNAARTLAVRPVEEAGSNIMLASRVIAINLAKFAQSASVFDATEVNPASSPSWTTVATIAPTPSVTGDWVVIAFLTSDINESAGDIETRLQINPSGGGLVDNPAYTNTAPGNDAQDPLDETPFTVFKLLSLSSGGARTINYDVRRTAGTTGRIEDNGLVAFSVALASTDAAAAESATAADSPSAVYTAVPAQAETLSSTDAPSAVATMPASQAETVTASDASDASFLYTAAITESASATETEDALLILSADITEATGATDSPSAIATLPAEQSEPLSAADSPSVIYLTSAEQVESATATETETVTAVFAVDMAESVSATDSHDAIIVLPVSISETLSALDASDATAIYAVNLTETSAATETVDAEIGGISNINEAISALDASDVTAIYAVSLTEAISATETVDAEIGGPSNVTETVSALDASDVTVSYAVNLTETSTATEAVGVSIDWTSTVTETANALAASTVVAGVVMGIAYLSTSLTDVATLSDAAPWTAVLSDAAYENATVEDEPL